MVSKERFIIGEGDFFRDGNFSLSLIGERDKEAFFLTIGPLKYAKTEECKEYMRQHIWNELNDAEHISFSIRLDEEFIGYCQLNGIGSDSTDIGIELLPERRSKGFGYRACRALIDAYFQRSDNERLLYKVSRDNTASLALVRKLGGQLLLSKYSTGLLMNTVANVYDDLEGAFRENGKRLREAIYAGFKDEKERLRAAGVPEDELLFEIKRK